MKLKVKEIRKKEDLYDVIRKAKNNNNFFYQLNPLIAGIEMEITQATHGLKEVECAEYKHFVFSTDSQKAELMEQTKELLGKSDIFKDYECFGYLEPDETCNKIHLICNIMSVKGEMFKATLPDISKSYELINAGCVG